MDLEETLIVEEVEQLEAEKILEEIMMEEELQEDEEDEAEMGLEGRTREEELEQ